MSNPLEGMPHPDRPARRYRALAAALAGLACLLFAGDAFATLRTELVWISTTGSGTPGSNVIDAEPGDTLVLQIRIHVDSAGIQSYGLSVAFDEDLKDELDIVDVTELDDIPTLDCEPFPDCYSQNPLYNLTAGVETQSESSLSAPGLVGSFEASAKSAPGPVDFMSPVGTITFQVTDNVATDGVDLEGSVLTDVDGYLDNALNFVGVNDLPNPAIVPGFATVNLTPEPGAGSLAAAAALTLAWLRRRTRAR